MSHKIRTPLNAIMGFAEVMEMEIFGPVGEPRYQKCSADIHACGRHLLSLIEDILDLSKLEAGQMELKKGRVNVAKVIESSLYLLKQRLESGEIKLAVRIAKNLPALRGDERRMRQVLFNLVSECVQIHTGWREGQRIGVGRCEIGPADPGRGRRGRRKTSSPRWRHLAKFTMPGRRTTAAPVLGCRLPNPCLNATAVS